jgi:UDP-N-acetylmuramoyl-L-alanyl-D-glutamate--2,6-diaminopimelate ligase
VEWRQEIPVISVPRLSTLLTQIAARFFNNPAKKLQTIGVTGTNGKTSCSHYTAQALQFLHQPCAVIGTLGSGFPGALKETLMTTPDTVSLQRIFSDLVAQEAQSVAMEVSSHSLDQERIAGLKFDVGMFTNLTQDHLDYHGDMASYGAAKKRFFTEYPMRQAVLNADDEFGLAISACLPREKVITYSAKNNPQADVYAEKAHFDLAGIRADMVTPWGKGELYAPLIGDFNLSNVLAVLSTLGSMGFPLTKILPALAQLKPVAGRMQMFGGVDSPCIIVDYAHTPDALMKALRALRVHCQGKLYCLFGCGGDRDKAKRPLMGAIAEQYADVVMVTNDNPRHEQPEAIAAEILAGFKQKEKALVQLNRSQAIQDIIQCAVAGDYVLIAGKGAEDYQQIGDEKFPFSDAGKIKEILELIS